MKIIQKIIPIQFDLLKTQVSLGTISTSTKNMDRLPGYNTTHSAWKNTAIILDLVGLFFGKNVLTMG